MAQTSMLHVRLDENIKAQGNAALAAMGLTAADAIRLFYHRIIAEQAFPLELKVPNSTTRAAMNEAEELLAKRSNRFKDGDDLIAGLDA